MLETWWRVISAARWFSGKGLEADLVSIDPLPWFVEPGDGPGVRAEVATVAYADGRREFYQLLVGYLTDSDRSLGSAELPGLGTFAVVEATSDPSSMRALLTALVDGHPEVRWLDAAPIDVSLPTRVWAGEQSNTTVCLGDTVLVKFFRKLDAGRNLDVEVLEALNGSGDTPELYGVLTGTLPGGERADLGMLVERRTEVSDGWQWACAQCAEGRPIPTEARALGAALRHVHRLLADAFGTSERPGAEVAAGMRGRLDAAIAQVGELADHATSLRLALGGLAGRKLATQRVHGDFHLGQVLHANDPAATHPWTIIDFEGEPLKTLAERREFDSVWRDVAGMLRSFDYVRGAHQEPTSPEARRWAKEAASAFLDGYCDGDEVDQVALSAYQVDKAVYEVVYEVRNRPHWAHIPLGAVQEEARRVALHPPHNDQEED